MPEEAKSNENLANPATLNARKAMAPLTPKQREIKQKKFLKAYSEIGIVKYACQVAGISRTTYKYWRDHDEAFSAQLEEAREEANDSLEYAAHEQAVIGIFEPVVSMGRIVYEEIPVLDEQGNPVLDEKGRPKTKQGEPRMRRVLAPSLLQTLLKANMPDKYKDKQKLELTGKDEGPVDVTVETFWGRGTDPRRTSEPLEEVPAIDEGKEDSGKDDEFGVDVPGEDEDE